MASEGKWVRASTALNGSYEAESDLQSDLQKTDTSNSGKLLRALIRAGYKASHGSHGSAAAAAVAHPGGGQQHEP